MSHVRASLRLAPLCLAALACGGADETSSSAAQPDNPGLVPAATASVSDTFTLRGVAPRASGGFPSVVQLFASVESATEKQEGSRPDPEAVVMDQYGNEFHPSVLIVSTGGRVAFKNSEDVLHNVRVVNRETHETIFNVGTPVVGSYVHRFETPGVYDVSCQIHPSMAAFLVVTDAARAVVAEERGEFAIEGVPAGTYRVRVWNLDKSRHRERRVTLAGDLTLDLTREEGDLE